MPVIRYYRTNSGREPVREYINSLPCDDQASIFGDLEIIETSTVTDSRVVTRKLLGYKGLWEIKTGRRHQQRIFYCVVTDDGVYLLHACKKQKDSQPRDVKIAAKRQREIES